MKNKKNIALANKETLVAAGELISSAVRRYKVQLLPVDSEHNAIFQCLAGIPRREEWRRLILTASGGPFRGWSADQLRQVSVADALKHPTWNMGRKITIDSATMMNKGLEVIEAHWLFGMNYRDIDVIVHPQSVIHSMVETMDGSILAQLGPTDMRLPIQYAFEYPVRSAGRMQRLDLFKVENLSFEKPDMKNFACLALAYRAGEKGGILPAVLNAANEKAVEAFLDERVSFVQIPVLLKKVLKKFENQNTKKLTLDVILEADQKARETAERMIGSLK